MTYNYANINNPQFQSGHQATQSLQRAVATAPQRYGAAVNKLNGNLQSVERDLYVKLQEQEQAAVTEKKENKKRNWKALGLTLATVVGLAVLGNRSSNKMAHLGQKVDDYLVNKSWYQSFEKGCTNLKNKVKNFFLGNNNKFIKETSEDIAETYGKRHATNKLKIANGYGRGFESIFSLTPPDVIRHSLTEVNKKSPAKALESLEKLVGKEKAQVFYDQLFGKAGLDDNRKFCKELTDAIAEKFGARKDGVTDTKKLLKVFEDMQKGSVDGVDLSEFVGVKMNKGEGLLGKVMGNWSSVNAMDTVGGKVAKMMGKEWKGFGRGNLGDSLVKVNAVNGSLAKTGAGSFVQKCITVPCESISNFVNDKSNVGIGLSALIYMLYQNMQKAPKEQKVATVANDYIGTLGSLAIATPLAFGATYKLATMANLEGKTWLTKILKWPGKIFNLGLKQYGKDGKVIEEGAKTFGKTLKNGCGHTLRFALIMFGFTSLFMKPINKITQKIFGKPYDSTEDDAKKEQMKQLKQQEIQNLYAQYIQMGGQVPQAVPIQ